MNYYKILLFSKEDMTRFMKPWRGVELAFWIMEQIELGLVEVFECLFECSYRREALLYFILKTN